MKFLKIFFSLIVFIVLFAAVGLFFFLKTFDINKFKPEIVNQTEKILNRKVGLGAVKLDFSLFKGTRLDISRILIIDDKDFDYGNFLEADSISLQVDVWKFLTQRRLSISKIEIGGAFVHVIRLPDGRTNIPLPPPSEDHSDKPADFSFLTIDGVKISRSRVDFTDRSVTPALHLSVSNIEADVRSFGFDKKVPFEAKWGVFAPEANFNLQGVFQADPSFQNISFENVELKTSLSSIVLADLKKQLAAWPAFGNVSTLKGDILVFMPNVSAGPSGLTALTADLEVKDVTAISSDWPIPLENVNGKIRLTPTDLDMMDWKIPLASGEVLMRAKISDYWIRRTLDADIQVRDMTAAGLIRDVKPLKLPEGVAMDGKVNADLSFQGTISDPADPLKSVSGRGSVSLTEGLVSGFSVMNYVMERLDRLSQILGPGVKDAILAKLPPEYAAKMNIRETPIRQMRMDFDLQDQKFNFHNTSFGVEEGTLTADGTVDMAGNISVQAQVFFDSKLTEVILRAVEDLRVFVGDDGRMSIPLKVYNGPLTGLDVYSDRDLIIKKLAGARIRKEIKGVVADTINLPVGLLEAILPEGKQPTTDNAGEEGDANPPKQDKTIRSQQDSTPGRMIGGVLDAVLGQ